MDHHNRPHRRTAVVTTTAPHDPKDRNDITSPAVDPLIAISNPAGYLVQLAAYPFLSLLTDPGAVLLRRLSIGLLGAAHAVAVLAAALVVAAVIGVGLVRLWAEEPVVVRRPLYFDYTNAEPTAVVPLGGAGVKGRAIPPGHTTRVSLELLMPESDYNRYTGIFQVTAEAIASNGDTVASSSQPCMLRFRSLPVRLMRTFTMGIPLVVGMLSESQRIEFEVLRYKESSAKPTAGVRVKLKPRAGTSDLPQVYGAEIMMNSQLPRRRQIVHDWRRTFYVWVSLYVYIMLLVVLACYFKPFAFPRDGDGDGRDERPSEGEEDDRAARGRGEPSEGVSGALRRWRSERGRSELKGHAQPPELTEGSASSVAGGWDGEVIGYTGEDFAAFESS